MQQESPLVTDSAHRAETDGRQLPEDAALSAGTRKAVDYHDYSRTDNQAAHSRK